MGIPVLICIGVYLYCLHITIGDWARGSLTLRDLQVKPICISLVITGASAGILSKYVLETFVIMQIYYTFCYDTVMLNDRISSGKFYLILLFNLIPIFGILAFIF